jgi:chorismate mutase/prephenate dehydratase
MSDTGESDARTLAELRGKIDAIDAEVHRLLMARAEVIGSLIRTKGTSRPGNAFRPGREADMMRRLVARHEGALPLATVEHIWREIITTFTHVQAPFDVAMDISVEPERMRDLARFYFGFSVDLVPIEGAAATVTRVAGTNSLGLIARDQPPQAGAWWRGLIGAKAPRIMALLPFIGAKGRPADLPAFVVSPPLADPTASEIRIFAARTKGGFDGLPDAVVLGRAGDDALLALPASFDPKAVAAHVDGLDEVGGIFRGIAIGAPDSLLYERSKDR